MPSFPITVKRGSVRVKIYRTPTRGFDAFTVCHYQDGRRVRALFADLGKARTEAEAIATRLGNVEADVLTLTSADRAAYLRARALLDPLGIAVETAASEVADAVKRLKGRRVPFSRLVDDYLRRHPIDMEPKTTPVVVEELLLLKAKDGVSERYQRQLGLSLRAFAKRFGGPIGEVRGTAIDDWVREQNWAPRTRNNLRNSLQTLFNFAVARRYVPKDHDELEAVAVAKDNHGDIEIFTPAELRELLAHAPKGLVPFLTLGAFAGIRHAEIQRLDWRDIQLEHDLIEIRAANAKTASRRMIPITPNLKEWLTPLKEEESGRVCGFANTPDQIESVLTKVNRARRAAWASAKGIGQEALMAAEKQARARRVEERAKRGGRRQRGTVAPAGAETAAVEGWAPFAWKHNALRHSFISYRVAEVQNVAQVALEAGNSPQMIFQHYRELVRPAVAKEWFEIKP